MHTEQLSYSVQVGIPYGKLNNVILWCQANCRKNWKYIVVDYGGQEPGLYEFFFDDEKDYMTFLLVNK